MTQDTNPPAQRESKQANMLYVLDTYQVYRTRPRFWARQSMHLYSFGLTIII